MHTLYKLVAFPALRHPSQVRRRVVLCTSASSGAMAASPDLWPTPAGSSSDKPRAAAARKRLLVAGVDQAELMEPWLLADPDSRFAELHGVHIHYKIATGEAKHEQDDVDRREELDSRDEVRKAVAASNLHASPSISSASLAEASSPQSSPSTERASPKSGSPETAPPSPSPTIPAILLHGFGASLFSWERVMKRLADILRSHVVAFDRPAFGLTSRIDVPKAKNAFGHGGLTSVAPNPYTVAFSAAATLAFIDFLKASKAVLIGHSAGCIIAADAYFKAPERIAAMIFVAPALFAPLVSRKEGQSHQEQNTQDNVMTKIWMALMSLCSKLGEFIQFVVSVIQLLFYRLLAAFLRSNVGHWLVRNVMDKLSLQAVRMAWHDKKKIDDYVISGYTKPLKCRNWERALLEYVIALTGDPSMDKGRRPISQRLEEIQCPVLVISGDSDALVPAWNAERLSRVLPNAQYHIIKNCGHLPQEETPEEFLRIICQFMQQVQQGWTKEQTMTETAIFMPA